MNTGLTFPSFYFMTCCLDSPSISLPACENSSLAPCVQRHLQLSRFPGSLRPVGNTALLLAGPVQLFNYTACPSQELSGLFCAKHMGRPRTFSCSLPHCPGIHTSYALHYFSLTQPWFAHSICPCTLPKCHGFLLYQISTITRCSQPGLNKTQCPAMGRDSSTWERTTLSENVWGWSKRLLIGGEQSKKGKNQDQLIGKRATHDFCERLREQSYTFAKEEPHREPENKI